METIPPITSLFLQLSLVVLCIVVFYSSGSSATTKTFHFHVKYENVTRLCHTKPLLTVNGEYPGPAIYVDEGDFVIVKVTNHVPHNTTIHWHGIRQRRTGWSDGPAYITQCPIQKGHTYTYRFSVDNHRGTLFWHAHISWQRASVHGAFIIRPSLPYPFPTPHQEIPIVLGEWWNEDVLAVEEEAMRYGGGPNISAAYTINSQPGLLYQCSFQDKFVIKNIEKGKTYMLRLINAALNDELFFAIEDHELTVVEADASYTKPAKHRAVMIAPGQTMNLLLHADQKPSTYVIAARPYTTAFVPYDHSTTTALLQYSSSPLTENQQTILVKKSTKMLQKKQLLPLIRDTSFATKFASSLRSLNSREYPTKVPKTVDKRLFLAIGLNLQDCPPGETCKGYFGGRFSASINNQSFVRPATAILQAAYFNKSAGVFSPDFPERPKREFDYTNELLEMNLNAEMSTRVAVIPFGANVELVLQNTYMMGFENHPIHIHGFNFFVVAQGFGNFEAQRENCSDSTCVRLNLEDAVERNTVAVPSGGWVLVRFKADNPGVWFMHCHLEVHTTWGLASAFLVQNGVGDSQSLPPPPEDLPPC